MNPKDFQTLYNYNLWANARVLDAEPVSTDFLLFFDEKENK